MTERYTLMQGETLKASLQNLDEESVAQPWSEYATIIVYLLLNGSLVSKFKAPVAPGYKTLQVIDDNTYLLELSAAETKVLEPGNIVMEIATIIEGNEVTIGKAYLVTIVESEIKEEVI